MTFWFIKFLVTVAFFEPIRSHPLACFYNGTSYAEGDAVQTKEPCLSCTCQLGSLNCNLRVCPDVPDLLSPGCFLVHKSNDCCPKLLCEANANENTGVEVRTAFATEQTKGKNDCLKNGTLYAEGSAVGSSNLCEYCYCIRREIKCIKPKCYMPQEGCRPIYHQSSCCPTHYDCRDEPLSTSTSQFINNDCQRNGTIYADGEMIPAVNATKCERCYCVKGKILCTPMICSEQSYFDNCQPSKVEDQCCPTSFSCDNFTRTVDNFTETSEYFDTVVTEPTTNNLEERNITKVDNATIVELFLEDTTLESSPNNNSFVSEQEQFTEFPTEFTIESFEYETTTTILPPTILTDDTTIETAVVTTFKTLVENKTTERIAGASTSVIVNSIVQKSTQQTEEYDNYDYNEPKLPPSLPNLVIYPFVAADAIVNDHAEASAHQTDVLKNYYNEFFSPPINTEGGFVPNQPQSLLKHLENQDSTTKSTHLAAATQQIHDILKNDPKSSQERLTLRMGEPLRTTTTSSSVPDLSVKSTPPQLTKLSKKPVTVTYKNAILDYYPDYPETSSADFHFKKKLDAKQTPMKNGLQKKITYFTSPNIPVLTVTDRSAENFYTKSTKSIPHIPVIDKTSILTDIFKSFLEESRKQTATVTPPVKKISSTTVTTMNFLTSNVALGGVPTMTPFASSNISAKSSLVAARPREDNAQSLSFFPDESSVQKYKKTKDETIHKRKHFEALIKLAGCNIYGKMYTTGKIIVELSGPCNKCVCTEVGVDCTPQNC